MGINSGFKGLITLYLGTLQLSGGGFDCSNRHQTVRHTSQFAAQKPPPKFSFFRNNSRYT